VNTQQFGDPNGIVNNSALTFSIHRMKLIAAAVKGRQRQTVLLKHGQEPLPFILAFQKRLQVGMRGSGPVPHTDF
jgi:hypothetical protein